MPEKVHPISDPSIGRIKYANTIEVVEDRA